MAKFETDIGLDELMQSLTSIDIEALAPIALEESAPIVEKKLVQLSEPHKKTGAMVKSIKAQKSFRGICTNRGKEIGAIVGTSQENRRDGEINQSAKGKQKRRWIFDFRRCKRS